MAGYDDEVKKIFAQKILGRLSEGIAYNSKKKKHAHTHTYLHKHIQTLTHAKTYRYIHICIFMYPEKGVIFSKIYTIFQQKFRSLEKKTKFCRIKNQKILFRGFVSTEIRISYPDIELLILAQ